MSDNKFREIDEYIEQLDNGEILPQELYNHKMVNWSGPSFPDREKSFYTDYIAEQLLGRQDLLKIDIESDRADYFVEGHDGVTNKHTNRTEEIFAKNILGHSLEHLGKVIGYQMPLKAKREDSFGKVDLVSFDDEGTAYLIELKMADKKETLLRAALEIYTYHQIINEDILIDFLNNKEERFGITAPTKKLPINSAILFAVKESNLPKELQPEHKNAYKNLWDLLSDLEIRVYAIPETYPVARYELPKS